MAKKHEQKETEHAQNEQARANAVEMLDADHQKIEGLFQQFESASDEEKPSLATQIFNELEIHAALEEEIFYPAVREGVDLKELAEMDGIDTEEEAHEESDVEVAVDSEETGADIIAISYEEHQEVKDLVQALKKLDSKSQEFQERFVLLVDSVLSHASEEEDLIFPAAKLHLNLEELGAKMQQRRIELAASMSRQAA